MCRMEANEVDARGVVEEAGRVMHPRSAEVRTPGEAVVALEGLAKGMTMKEAAKASGLCHRTVWELSRRHPEWLEGAKRLQAGRARELAGKLMEATYREAERLCEDEEARRATGIKELSVASGIWVDKAERLMGGGVEKVVVEAGPGLEAVVEAMGKLREKARGRVIDAETGEEVEG